MGPAEGVPLVTEAVGGPGGAGGAVAEQGAAAMPTTPTTPALKVGAAVETEGQAVTPGQEASLWARMTNSTREGTMEATGVQGQGQGQGPVLCLSLVPLMTMRQKIPPEVALVLLLSLQGQGQGQGLAPAGGLADEGQGFPREAHRARRKGLRGQGLRQGGRGEGIGRGGMIFQVSL